MMSRKDFIKLASELREWHRAHGAQNVEEAYQSNEEVLKRVCDACRRCNPRFDETRFRAAVRGERVPLYAYLRRD